MPLLQQKERESLTKDFADKLKDEVRLVVFTQTTPCDFCDETVRIADELAGMSPKIALEVYDFVKDQIKAKEFRIDKIPAIAVIGAKDHGIRFYGVPAGYEFNSLVGAILDVSSGESGLKPKTKDLISHVDRAVHIQVFVTPTCPYCPSAVRLAHKFAIESDMVWADMIEANEFVHLAQKYSVMGVPKIVLNEKNEVSGAVSEELFAMHILHALMHPEPLQPR